MAVLALDAKYNIFRTPKNTQFKTLYIRRRSQILREKSKLYKEPSVIKNYLKIRASLLRQRYGLPSTSEQSSNRSNTASLKSTRDTLNTSEESLPRLQKMQAEFLKRFQPEDLTITPTNMAEASRAMAGECSIAENYQFTGVHHIFDQHKKAVTCVKFANDDKSRLACASIDATISICQLIPLPATVICTLIGHTAGVTGLCWSLSNDMLLSCSLDASSRLWQVSTGECLRVINNHNDSKILTCLFQPTNNNLFAIGDTKNTLQVINLSTGKVVKGGTSSLPGQVLSLSFDSGGRLLWAGDSRGHITSFRADPLTGRIIRARKLVLSEGSMISSISSRCWLDREARDPCLLVNSANHSLWLLRVTDKDGGLKVRRRFPIKHSNHVVKSCFCPLISFRPGACVVSGSEDGTIYFFDVTKDSKSCINKLQGHSAAILDVAFSNDESMLASCDAVGVVIVWKREDGVVNGGSDGVNVGFRVSSGEQDDDGGGGGFQNVGGDDGFKEKEDESKKNDNEIKKDDFKVNPSTVDDDIIHKSNHDDDQDKHNTTSKNDDNDEILCRETSVKNDEVDTDKGDKVDGGGDKVLSDTPVKDQAEIKEIVDNIIDDVTEKKCNKEVEDEATKTCDTNDKCDDVKVDVGVVVGPTTVATNNVALNTVTSATVATIDVIEGRDDEKEDVKSEVEPTTSSDQTKTSDSAQSGEGG